MSSWSSYPKVYALDTDLLGECGDEIRERLFQWAWKQMGRGVTGGLPEWYKEQLLARSFEEETCDNP